MKFCNEKIDRNWGLLNMSHWESTHGEFEFPEFIFIQMIAESAEEGRARMFVQL